MIEKNRICNPGLTDLIKNCQNIKKKKKRIWRKLKKRKELEAIKV